MKGRNHIHGRRLAFGLGLGVMAVAIAFGSSASARSLITGADVKNGSLTGADIRNGSLSGADIQAKSIALSDLTLRARASLRGQQGPTGPIGAKGATGAPGPVAAGTPGANGVSGYEVRTWRYSKDDANSDMGPGYVGVGGGAIATVACSTNDKVAVGGGYWFTSDHGAGFNSPAVTDGSGVVASFPGRMDWTTNTVKPNNNTGWIVQVNNRVTLADMTMYVICVNAS